MMDVLLYLLPYFLCFFIGGLIGCIMITALIINQLGKDENDDEF